MSVGCDCSSILPIDTCAPYAHQPDVVRALEALSQCVVGTVANTTDPTATPAAAVSEAFPTGFDPNCEPDYLFVKRPDGAIYLSVDSGTTFVNVGGTGVNAVQADAVTNNAGATLVLGTVVVWDSSVDRAVKTVTVDQTNVLAGIWTETTLSGAEGVLTNRGIGVVLVDSAVTRGDALVISASVAGRATRGNAHSPVNRIGTALESIGGSGAVLAFIDAQSYNPRYAEYSYTVAQNTAGFTFTAGADRTVPLNTEDQDLTGIGVLASNQVTLQPGIYHVTGGVSVRGNGSTGSLVRPKIHNVTAAADLLIGANVTLGTNEPGQLVISGEIRITTASVIELRIRTTSTTVAVSALNIASQTEKYAYLTLGGKH